LVVAALREGLTAAVSVFDESAPRTAPELSAAFHMER